MFKRTLLLVALAVFAGPTDPAHAGGKNVAIIDNFDAHGSFFCQLLTEHGHACTVFPMEGPTAPLDSFDVVIDMSHIWSDPTGMLADFMRAGKTVIATGNAPYALGVDTNPTVQAWIGANANVGAGGPLVTVARDPILGDIPAGTQLTDCSDSVCGALRDTTGHPNAKVLAMYVDYPDPRPIGILRNFWEAGVSVYMPGFSPEFILNALEVRNPIPTLNTWGLLALALGIGAAGTIVLWRRRSLTRSPATLPALLIGSLLVTTAPLQADVTSSREGDVTYLRIGDAGPFYSTQRTVVDLRSVGIPESAGIAVLWEETTSDGSRVPWYAISLGGKIVDEVRATSYDLRLRYARFDPGVEEPAIGAALSADPDSELYIVQFVTQSLSEFRSAIEPQGATIYDFLPNHAYIAKIPAKARAAVAALPFVRAVVPYHPGYRLEEFLRDNLDRAEQLFPLQRYNIRVFSAGQKPAVAARIALLGGLVNSADAGKRMVEATLTPAQLLQVARFDEVLFIDRWSPMHPDMNVVRKMPLLPDGSDGGANYLQTVAGYRGSGVRGEVFDFGFNTGHQDFGNLVGDLACPVARLGLIEHAPPVGDAWHGASTSGIIFGNGFGKPDAKGLLPCGQGIVANA